MISLIFRAKSRPVFPPDRPAACWRKASKYAQSFVLLDHRFIDLRVGVPDADGQNPAEAIEIPISRIVPDIFAFAFHERDRLLIIVATAGKRNSLCLRIASDSSVVFCSVGFILLILIEKRIYSKIKKFCFAYDYLSFFVFFQEDF